MTEDGSWHHRACRETKLDCGLLSCACWVGHSLPLGRIQRPGESTRVDCDVLVEEMDKVLAVLPLAPMFIVELLPERDSCAMSATLLYEYGVLRSANAIVRMIDEDTYLAWKSDRRCIL